MKADTLTDREMKADTLTDREMKPDRARNEVCPGRKLTDRGTKADSGDS